MKSPSISSIASIFINFQASTLQNRHVPTKRRQGCWTLRRLTSPSSASPMHRGLKRACPPFGASSGHPTGTVWKVHGSRRRSGATVWWCKMIQIDSDRLRETPKMGEMGEMGEMGWVSYLCKSLWKWLRTMWQCAWKRACRKDGFQDLVNFRVPTCWSKSTCQLCHDFRWLVTYIKTSSREICAFHEPSNGWKMVEDGGRWWKMVIMVLESSKFLQTLHLELS